MEQQYLHEATRGDLEHVFLVRMFGGYLALPRTFIVGYTGSSKLRFISDLHKDATLTQSAVDAGILMMTSTGQLMDASTHESLPSNPLRTERRGRLTIELFSPTPGRSTPLAIIRDESQYLRLYGSAVVLADDLVAAYEALTGPPSIAVKNLVSECQSGALTFVIESTSRDGATLVGFRVQPGYDLHAFQLTGFLPNDFVVGVNNEPLGGEDLYQLLRDIMKGRSSILSVERGGKLVELRLTAAAARAALGKCL